MIPINKRRIGVCILLSIVTLGIYGIFWLYLLVKNVRAINEDKSDCVAEMLCLIFVPFYLLYWYITRGNIIKQKLAELDVRTESNQLACLFLGFFGLHIVAFAIIQNDFNTLSGKKIHAVTRNERAAKFVSMTGIYLFLIVMALIVLFPFYWMIISSLKTLPEYKLSPPTFWPKEIKWSNYANAFSTAKLGRLFMNTMYVGVVSTLLSVIITILTAFAFARLEFKGKETLFAALLATMMIPGELFTITNFSTVISFDWLNTYTVLIVPFLVSVFYIYLLRQNFLQIPNELYLAAKVDGTSDWKYLWKVMVPLSLPTLISITILKMMGAWNSYIWPRLVANDDAHRLITNGLRNAFTEANTLEVDYPLQMAAVTLVSIPLFLVFVFLRKYIMAGVSRSGIKG